MTETQTDPLSVACPKCGAQPGEPCVTGGYLPIGDAPGDPYRGKGSEPTSHGQRRAATKGGDPGDPLDHSATRWARQNGVAYSWRTVPTAHEPPRDIIRGRCWEYPLRDVEPGATGTHGFVLDEVRSQIRAAEDCFYILQRGLQWVRVFYVAGYHRERDYLILHPVESTRLHRADNDRPVELGPYPMAPSRAYHLFLDRVPVRSVTPPEEYL